MFTVPILGALLLFRSVDEFERTVCRHRAVVVPGTQGETSRIAEFTKRRGPASLRAEALATVLATYPGGRLNWASFLRCIE